VNAGQISDWGLRVDLVNTGAAPVTIAAPAAGDIAFRIPPDLLTDYLVVAPAGLASGAPGLTIAGGGADSLIYTVSTTGSDTGLVDVSVTTSWTDDNDPGSGTTISTGGTNVHVMQPSGLRIAREHRPDVMWSTFPIATAHLLGWGIHQLTGIPWVADFRDSMTERTYPRDPTTWRVHRWIECRVVNSCDRAVFTTPGARRMYGTRTPCRSSRTTQGLTGLTTSLTAKPGAIKGGRLPPPLLIRTKKLPRKGQSVV